MLFMNIILKHIGISIFLFVNLVKCSIDGLTYMDQNIRRSLPSLYPRGEDPCNPLYWYPKNIPEYCYYRNLPIPDTIAPPLHIPIPVPIPQPNFIMPVPPLSAAIPGLAPLPYGVPSNLIYPVISQIPTYPYASNLYANNPQQAGMVPGLPGLVTKDGGINILPFSDAYSDLIEKHKNQMIRRRLKKLIQEYENFPNARTYRKLRKYSRRNN